MSLAFNMIKLSSGCFSGFGRYAKTPGNDIWQYDWRLANDLSEDLEICY